MSQAEDLLNSLTTDGEVEEHIVIGNDRFITVPQSLKKIAVQFDNNVRTVTFDCPRYSDGRDLSTMTISINYMRPDGDPGLYPVEAVTIDENDDTLIHFDWVIKDHITEVNGTLSFLVCAKKTNSDGTNENHWNSELNQEMTISKGLNCNTIIIEKNPDLITQILVRLDDVETREVTQDDIKNALGYVPPEYDKILYEKYEGTFINIQNSSDGTAHLIDIPNELVGHRVTCCGKNLFNINGDVNVNLTTGEDRPGYLVVENGVLTANLNTSSYHPNGQRLYNLKGKTITFSATCISEDVDGYIGIYENGSEEEHVAGKGLLKIESYVCKSDNPIFGFNTSGTDTGAKFTNIQIEIGETVTGYEAYVSESITISSDIDSYSVPVCDGMTNIYNDCNANMTLMISSLSVTTDKTLTESEKPADSKVVGDNINELKGDFNKLSEKIADKATLENGVVKFWKTSTEENRTDTLLYSVDISSIGGTGGLDLENLTLSVSQVGNYQRLSMSDGTTTKNVDIPITTITDEQVTTAVQKYLEENPVSVLDASTAETNQVPVADGNGNWSWQTQQSGTGSEETDPTVPNWAKQPNKPTYTADEVGALPDTTKIPSKTSDLQNDSGFLTEHQDLSGYAMKSEVPKSASDVGADASGTAENKVSTHNTDADAHNDIRLLLQGLIERLNALADSDDTTLDQMSEVVAYIKSNKSLIDAITTSKVNVSDIIDNLVTNVSNKPLSAAQGVALKALIDGIVIPEKLPNPYPLAFTGGASGSYDGSKALTINIPSGGDGSAYYVTPEQFGAIGDGVTDDTEAFRQAIETEYPIICMTGKDYYFANEIVTSKTRINIAGNYSHFTAFRLKINLNEDETNWKNPYPRPVSVIQNVYFVNKNNMDYCIKTGIPIKFVNINVYSYDLWLKNYGDYMDYMVFDNLAINSKPSNEHYCIELSYLGDNHVFRECMFVGHNTNMNCVQVSGCKAVNFIDCIINGNVIAYESVVNLNGCHFENYGQIICGDTKVNSVINFNGCLFYDQYSVTPGKNVFYNGCGFLVNYRAYGGQNDYMALNTRDCIILCGAESANSNANVIIDELRKNEYPNVVYSGNKVVFTPVVLKHTAKTWGLSAGTYTYKFFQSCNPYSIDYGDPAYSTVEESVTVDADTSAVRFSISYDTYPEMFIHAYRTAPDGSIKKVVIPINGQYIYDYGETLNGILWKEVESIPTPKSTTAVYHNGIYYSGKNYTNARNCICVDKANGVIVWIDENGSSTIISGSGSGGLTESQVNNLIDAKLTGVETLLGGGF